MKASVQRIVEQAKLRDSLGRNQIIEIDSGNLGGVLSAIQYRVSHLAGTKETYVELNDADGKRYLLRFNIGEIVRGKETCISLNDAEIIGDIYDDTIITAVLAQIMNRVNTRDLETYIKRKSKSVRQNIKEEDKQDDSECNSESKE